MTDLTEQWKKGELPEGVYYCNTGNNVEILFTWGKNYHQLTNNKDEVYIPEMDDCEIIAPVPTFDELQNMNKAVNECMAANIKLVEQNAQLKELLKECKEVMNMAGYVFANVDDVKKAKELLQKIDEVLK